MKEELEKELSALLKDEKLSWDKCQRMAIIYGALKAISSYQGEIIPLETKTQNKGNFEADKELRDILPALSEYLSVKQKYRDGTAGEKDITHYAEKLVVEINEFIVVLKAHATESEREIFARIK